MPKASPSGRSSGHVTLSFGLVNIPTTLYSGTVSAAGVERHEYITVPVLDENGQQKTVEVERDGVKETVPVFEDHEVGRGQIDKSTGELLTPDQKSQIKKKITTEYGPVFVEDQEIEALFTLQPDTLVVKEFQPQHLFLQGNYLPKALLFLEPEKTGTGRKKAHMPLSVKLLGTLFKGMKEEGVIAIGELTTRGVPKPCVITPDGACYLVYHTDATREQREFPEVALVDAEVQMMRQLIGQLKSNETTDLTDVRSALIQEFADSKGAAGNFDEPAEDAYVQAAPQEASVDLMAMLAQSVEAAKKVS